MNKSWVSGLEEQQAQEMKEERKASGLVLNRLRDMLEKDIEEVIGSMYKESNYESPEWAYKQADYLATIRAYKRIQKLVEV